MIIQVTELFFNFHPNYNLISQIMKKSKLQQN